MSTLYEIDAAILNCCDIETGEIIDADALDALMMEREQTQKGGNGRLCKHAGHARIIRGNGSEGKDTRSA